MKKKKITPDFLNVEFVQKVNVLGCAKKHKQCIFR